MLNLSDKELDRLGKEAAQEYEPGDVLGPRSWERLEIRLGRDLGRVNPNPLRHIRRFPFYYAPALLVLVGIAYFLVRQGGRGSGSPPGAVVQTPGGKNAPSSINPATQDNRTSTPATSSTVPSYPTAQPGGEGGDAGKAGTAAGVTGTAAGAAGTTGSRGGAGMNSAVRNGTAGAGRNLAGGSPASGRVTGSGRHSAGGAAGTGRGRHSGVEPQEDNAVAGTGKDLSAGGKTTVSQSRELGISAIQGVRPTKKAPYISDSALRAFTLKSTIQPLVRKGGLHINRSLQFGLVLAPDFASVNSVAGDKPGSTIGLTVDYQIASRWYVGTGILLARKNYAARSQDFHAPPEFYQRYNMNHVDIVKGTFETLEIPLNLRYDFSVSGSTLFFASGGVSSYLMTSENDNYYSNVWGRTECQNFPVNNHRSYLFSSLNLSLGVETGLSNSMSLLIAPYVKTPIRNIGFGQMDLSSVGINFALKFAPVVSRKRH